MVLPLAIAECKRRFRFAAPDAHLLFAQKSSISRMLLNAESAPEMVLPLQGLRNVRAVAQDPIDGHVYWIDGRTKTVRRALSNGTEVSCRKISRESLTSCLFSL